MWGKLRYISIHRSAYMLLLKMIMSPKVLASKSKGAHQIVKILRAAICCICDNYRTFAIKQEAITDKILERDGLYPDSI